MKAGTDGIRVGWAVLCSKNAWVARPGREPIWARQHAGKARGRVYLGGEPGWVTRRIRVVVSRTEGDEARRLVSKARTTICRQLCVLRWHATTGSKVLNPLHWANCLRETTDRDRLGPNQDQAQI